MRFAVLGTSEFTIRTAEGLIDSGATVCALISMPKHACPNNSVDMSSFAKEKDIQYHEVEEINSLEGLTLLRNCHPEYLFVSWPRMLKDEVLKVPRKFCIGTHSTDLPYNRGRHPHHWLIALNIFHTKLSFFRIDEGVDTGKLLLQVPVMLAPDDSIVDVDAKINKAAYAGTKQLYGKLLADPSYEGIEQDHSLANYWRKRTPHDVTIDFRMSSDMILRSVRSFGPPYPCANLIFEKHLLKIVWAQSLLPKMTSEQLKRIEPGTIIKVEANVIRVKTDDGIVELECSNQIPEELLKAKYIHPPSKYMAKYPRELSAKLSGVK